MPKKRTIRKSRLPDALDQISSLEKGHWAVYGPQIKREGSPVRTSANHVIWPSWDQWATFYGQCRDQYLAERRARAEPACERLYQAMQRGDDPDVELERMAEERAANDPRKWLFAGEPRM